MKIRCAWVSDSKLYQDYHDNEWGEPVYDDETLFEFLLLETFQAGLSWITILNKRENFRKAFDNFDYKKIAKYNQEKYESLLADTGIIRNKLKINSAIVNAGLFMEVQKEVEIHFIVLIICATLFMTGIILYFIDFYKHGRPTDEALEAPSAE